HFKTTQATLDSPMEIVVAGGTPLVAGVIGKVQAGPASARAPPPLKGGRGGEEPPRPGAEGGEPAARPGGEQERGGPAGGRGREAGGGREARAPGAGGDAQRRRPAGRDRRHQGLAG